jgi:hypothetical protein
MKFVGLDDKGMGLLYVKDDDAFTPFGHAQ